MANLNWLDAIADMGVAGGILEDTDVDLIHSCFVTRGPRKGLILAGAPSSVTQPLRAAAWQAIMSAIAPARVNIATVCWLLPADARAAFNRIEAWTSIRTVMDALNAYAQRAFEFNLCDVDPLPVDDFASRVYSGIDTFLAKRAFA
jgi:hypothetical protein